MNKATVLAFLDAEIERLQRARQLLSGNDGSAMSAEARRRISAAQKKRWAARKRAGL